MPSLRRANLGRNTNNKVALKVLLALCGVICAVGILIVNYKHNDIVKNLVYYGTQNISLDIDLPANATTIASKKTIRLKTSDSYGYLTTTFKPWNYNKYDFPCFPAERGWSRQNLRTPTRRGIIFIKNMKTGSSTVSGIAIRIARSMAEKQKGMSWNTEFPLCKVRFAHTSAMKFQCHLRDKEKSFLLSFVRDPIKRITSEFFHFSVSREKVDPSDNNFKQYILSQRHTDK